MNMRSELTSVRAHARRALAHRVGIDTRALAVVRHLGLFPLISITALLPFLPSVVWDTASRVAEPLRNSLDTTRLRERIRNAFPAFPAFEISEGISRWSGRIVQVVVAFLLVFVLIWNAATLGYVGTPNEVKSAVDPAEHRWSMFTPEPRMTDGWYVVTGQLESGRQVDAFHRRPVQWNRPPDVAGSFPSHRWLVYLLDLQQRGYEGLRPSFAEHVCQRWNNNHEDELVSVVVYYIEHPTRLDGPEPTSRVELAQHSCASGGSVG